MRFKQPHPRRSKIKYGQYDPSMLAKAYVAVMEQNYPVAKAAREFEVPMQTLRDRVLRKVDIETVANGRTPVLTLDEEAKIVSHLQDVADLGYAFTRQDIVTIATDYAIQLGKRTKDSPMTLNWFVKFSRRWPELSLLKPKLLENTRAKSCSNSTVSKYFEKLENIFDKYDLKDKPNMIYSFSEKEITQDHVVAGNSAGTSGKASNKTTTILCCGSANGNTIPPYFVFAGKRMLSDLLKGASPGASGTVSESGLSNTEVFQTYLQEHFIKFVPKRQSGEHLLLVLDGHKSHISVGLLDWAKLQNVVVIILPALTTDVLQPLDFGCSGPFDQLYHDKCQEFTSRTTSTITRHDVCGLVCQVYSEALSADNLKAAFRETDIYPFKKGRVSEENKNSSVVTGEEEEGD